MKQENIEDVARFEDVQDENEDIIKLWEPLDVNIDEKYEFVPKGLIFSLLSNFVYYIIAYPILKLVAKIVYDLEIEGKENLRDLKEGVITVSNHVLFLDCVMIGLAYGLKKVYFTTREGSFKIPGVRRLIKLLRAVPIPDSIKNKEYFLNAIDDILNSGKSIHLYPEASLFPYYNKIRHFKNGAFNIAVKNNKKIVPIVITFREPRGFRRFIKYKKDVTLTVLEPIDPPKTGDTKQKIEVLKEQVYENMKRVNEDKKEQIKNEVKIS